MPWCHRGSKLLKYEFKWIKTRSNRCVNTFLTCDKQETNCDCCFRDANFGRGSPLLILSQRFDVHFLRLCPQLPFMTEDMFDDLAVVVNDECHWDAVAEHEECCDKKLQSEFFSFNVSFYRFTYQERYFFNVYGLIDHSRRVQTWAIWKTYRYLQIVAQ